VTPNRIEPATEGNLEVKTPEQIAEDILPTAYVVAPGSNRAAMLIFATRYALGRRTFAPEIVRGELVVQSECLTVDDVDVLIRDIEAQAELGYGDRVDEEAWADTLAWLREMRPIIERRS
jgi:hypothetical protein